MDNQGNENLFEMIFDKKIIDDIQEKVIKYENDLDMTKKDDVLPIISRYIKRHYNVHNGYIVPKISNYYRNHKRFTRFVLILISIFDGESDIHDILNVYKFNEFLKWEVEHIVPQTQGYNEFNDKNKKLKNRLGNLTLLTKDTNSRISNKSFYRKCEEITSSELDMKVNEVFLMKKINFSKMDIKEREKELNSRIYEICYKEEGKILRGKLNNFFDKR